MKIRRSTALLLVLSMLALLLAGCGAKSGQSVAAPQAYNSGYAKEEMAMDMEVEAPSASPLTSNGSGSSSSLPANRKFIITVNLDAETEDLDSLLTNVNNKIASLGGYIENQNIYNGSSYSSRRYRNANLTVRIPVDRLSDFTEEVKAMANVVSNSQNTQDVTLRYVDTQSRITALETEQKRLLELLEQADNMTDLLEIEARLTEVRYELEQYSSTLRVLDNQIDYATIYLSISEVQEYTPVQEQTLWERIRDGFMGSLKDLGEFFEDLFAGLIIGLPYLVLFALMIWAVVSCSKRGYKKHKAKKMAKLAAQYQAMQKQSMQQSAEEKK